MSDFEVLGNSQGKIIKAWTNGVYFEEQAKQQLRNVASMPFIYKWVAAMPDVHPTIHVRHCIISDIMGHEKLPSNSDQKKSSKENVA